MNISTYNNPVRFIVTGGTFDKEYNEIEGELYFKETHIPEMLALAKNSSPFVIETLMMIDSLQMTESHRERIAAACLAAPENKLIITHGTDTMAVTAKKLCDLKIAHKTIVLTGAMIPYKFGSSDGLFNLGNALAYARCLPSGVYVAMNGMVFSGDNVVKDRALGRFRDERAILSTGCAGGNKIAGQK